MIQTDHFIREEAEKVHIPYWTDSETHAVNLREQLWRSKYGTYIKRIGFIRDRSGFIRGIEVSSEIGEEKIKTAVLFPSIPVVTK
jgi:hypothetical protein